MANFFVYRLRGSQSDPESIYSAPSYAPCLGFVTDYARAQGPSAQFGPLAVNEWYLADPSGEGGVRGAYQVLQIRKEEAA
jgi:hypothetical protein